MSIELVQMSKAERSSLQGQLEPKCCDLLSYKLYPFIFMLLFLFPTSVIRNSLLLLSWNKLVFIFSLLV